MNFKFFFLIEYELNYSPSYTASFYLNTSNANSYPLNMKLNYSNHRTSFYLNISNANSVIISLYVDKRELWHNTIHNRGRNHDHKHDVINQKEHGLELKLIYGNLGNHKTCQF